MEERSVEIELPRDDEGMLPRQCPNCEGKFSIHAQTYQDRHYLNLRCPYCGWIEEFEEFLKEEQRQYARAVGINKAIQMAEEKIKKTLKKKFKKVKTKGSSKKSVPSPHLSIETQKITCGECDFQYAVDKENDSGDYLCPVCR